MMERHRFALKEFPKHPHILAIGVNEELLGRVEPLDVLDYLVDLPSSCASPRAKLSMDVASTNPTFARRKR